MHFQTHDASCSTQTDSFQTIESTPVLLSVSLEVHFTASKLRSLAVVEACIRVLSFSTHRKWQPKFLALEARLIAGLKLLTFHEV